MQNYTQHIYTFLCRHIFKKMNLKGFVNWMNVQVQEEMAHARGLYDYIQERGGEIVLEAIAKPDLKWNSPLQVLKMY